MKKKENYKELLLKNAIRLLISGYLYDTNISDDIDEFDKLLDIPNILKEISEDYKEEINKNIKTL